MSKRLKCSGCGKPSGAYTTCIPCETARRAATETKWPIALGHAIARFCRRAEVAGLVRAADQALGDVIDMPDDIDAIDDAIKRHIDALSCLARLAGGGA